MSPARFTSENPITGPTISRGRSTRSIRASFFSRSLACVAFWPEKLRRMNSSVLAISICCFSIGAALHLEPLGLLLPVVREVAHIRLNSAIEQLQSSIGHAVEKIAVVADDDHRPIGFAKEILEPLGGLDIEVVRRLVEQHYVGLGQKHASQEQAVLLPAAELGDWLLVILGNEAKAR